jgi:hypothetical protein
VPMTRHHFLSQATASHALRSAAATCPPRQLRPPPTPRLPPRQPPPVIPTPNASFLQVVHILWR